MGAGGATERGGGVESLVKRTMIDAKRFFSCYKGLMVLFQSRFTLPVQDVPTVAMPTRFPSVSIK